MAKTVLGFYSPFSHLARKGLEASASVAGIRSAPVNRRKQMSPGAAVLVLEKTLWPHKSDGRKASATGRSAEEARQGRLQ